MSLPVMLRPLAEADVIEQVASFENIRAGLGGRFLKRLRETLERIESMPEMYGTIWEDVRAARLRKFRHVVYFVVLVDRVDVLAVLHGARDESTWKDRV